MKIRLLIAVLFVFSLAVACTQKTCPTYAKEDVQIEKTKKVRV